MKIVIDGTSPVDGAGRVWLNRMPQALKAVGPENEVVVFVRSDMEGLDPELGARTRVIVVRFPPAGRLLWRLLWQQLALPLRLRSLRTDLLISPYEMTPFAAPCPVVLGVQNANPYVGPAPAGGLWGIRLFALRWITARSARKADRVFFVSEWSRREIGKALGISSDKTSVVPNGVSADFFVQPDQVNHRAPVRGGYVLSVGTIGSYKDYLTLIEAWPQLTAPHAQDLSLRIVGPVLDQAYLARMTARITALGLEERVLILPAVDSSELVAMYRGAQALVMASQVETFGMPMIEAMASRIPVVASDIPVTREVCAEAALYYRLGDSVHLASQLDRILEEPETRADLGRAASQRAPLFTWESAATRLLALGRVALASHSSKRA